MVWLFKWFEISRPSGFKTGQHKSSDHHLDSLSTEGTSGHTKPVHGDGRTSQTSHVLQYIDNSQQEIMTVSDWSTLLLEVVFLISREDNYWRRES